MNPWPVERLKYTHARLGEAIQAFEESAPDYVTAYSKLYLVVGSFGELRSVLIDLKRKVRAWRPTDNGK